MQTKLFKEIKLQSGTVLTKGTPVTVTPVKGSNTLCEVTLPEGRKIGLRYTSVFKAPSLSTVKKWDYDGYCKTPAGKRTEPDGHDPEGFPSWMLIQGFL